MVPHPRFGTRSVPSGCTASEEEVRRSYFAYATADIFPRSAIPADLSRQNFSTFPRGYYVDMRGTCRRCGRPFIFFAREQQHWYEDLGFYIDAQCVHCVECRRSSQELKRRFVRYGRRAPTKELSDEALEVVLGDAAYLFEAGLLFDEQPLRALKNAGRKRIPESRALRALERLLAEKSGG
jgi:hypothetical protein